MSLLYGVEARFPALFFSTFRVVKQKKKKDASVTLVSNHLFISLYACSMCFTFKRKLPREKPPIFIFAVCEHYCYWSREGKESHSSASRQEKQSLLKFTRESLSVDFNSNVLSHFLSTRLLLLCCLSFILGLFSLWKETHVTVIEELLVIRKFINTYSDKKPFVSFLFCVSVSVSALSLIGNTIIVFFYYCYFSFISPRCDSFFFTIGIA